VRILGKWLEFIGTLFVPKRRMVGWDCGGFVNVIWHCLVNGVGG